MFIFFPASVVDKAVQAGIIFHTIPDKGSERFSSYAMMIEDGIRVFFIPCHIYANMRLFIQTGRCSVDDKIAVIIQGNITLHRVIRCFCQCVIPYLYTARKIQSCILSANCDAAAKRRRIIPGNSTAEDAGASTVGDEESAAFLCAVSGPVICIANFTAINGKGSAAKINGAAAQAGIVA